ncbi:MAG: DUF835 domain-containing protein, partial [Candidatus Thermoplasmatota archaeon]
MSIERKLIIKKRIINSMLELSAKEKILLFLRDHIEEKLGIRKDIEPPIIFSQEGIIECTTLSHGSVVEGLKKLEKEGLIERERFHIKETGRFRNFYFLTVEGIQKATELQEEIGKRKIKVREKDEIKEMKISTLIDYLKKIVRKPIEQGYSYIMKGEKTDEAYEVFKELIREGYNGIVFSDVSPKKIREKYQLKEDIYWISEIEGENVLRPERLDFELMGTISNFLRENDKPIIMLEGFEYLSRVNGFDTCIRWLKIVKDVVAKNNGIFVLPINPTVFSERELSVLLQNLEL